MTQELLRFKNAKFSGYYFYMNANTQGHFQICIGVPFRREDGQISLEVFYKKTKFCKNFKYLQELLKIILYFATL